MCLLTWKIFITKKYVTVYLYPGKQTTKMAKENVYACDEILQSVNKLSQTESELQTLRLEKERRRTLKRKTQEDGK